MKALSYLLVKQLKNRIISLKRKPGMLILYCIVVAVILFSIIFLLVSGENIDKSDYADERILYLLIAGFGLLFLWMFTNSGLSTGSSLFTMPDVGLLFVAPISSKKILMYGLLSTLGKSLLGSVFILYQVGNLRTNFGFGFIEIMSLFIIFALMVVFCQLLSIGIYIFSNGNPVRKNLIKVILYAFLIFIAATALLLQRQEHLSLFDAVLQLTSSRWFGFTPIAGWMTMFFIGVVQNSLSMILISLVLFFVVGFAIVLILTAGKADYYEDVLLSTETTYQTQRAAKEGRRVTNAQGKKIKVKDEDQGIRHGRGAMTLAYRHILEMKRKSRFVFADNYTAFAIIAAGFAGYYFRSKGAPVFAVYAVLGVGVYIQMLFNMMGKLQTELIKPYIYLIPEKSIKKVFAASITSLIKPCLDGFLIFIVLTVSWRSNPMECLFSAAAYAASGAVFVGFTILYQRVLGGQPNKLVKVFVGLILLFIVMAPAIGVSVATALFLPTTLQFLCTLPYTIFCLMFAALIFVSCGNLIDKAEFSGKI